MLIRMINYLKKIGIGVAAVAALAVATTTLSAGTASASPTTAPVTAPSQSHAKTYGIQVCVSRWSGYDKAYLRNADHPSQVIASAALASCSRKVQVPVGTPILLVGYVGETHQVVKTEVMSAHDVTLRV